MSGLIDSLALGSRARNASEPSWLADLRQEAIDTLLRDGLPTSKTEAWRYTGLRNLVGRTFSASATSDDVSAESCKWADKYLGECTESTRVYVVNGRPVASSVAAAASDDVQVSSLSQLLSDSPKRAETLLATQAHKAHFSALNAALFEDGVFVQVPASKKPRALHIIHISSSEASASASHPRLVVSVGANAECTLVETYLTRGDQQSLCTAVTEVHLADGAHLDHLRVVEGSDHSTDIGTLAVRQESNSRYQSRSVIMGGKLSRLEIDARLVGDGSECNLDGVYHAVGSEHIAHHTVIHHEASHCSSGEEYRGLIDDRAHAVFDGIIVVGQGTKNTSAHQQNHNLLLSESATINTKPHLEIDSDDLTASHGATIGALNPDQLFFLRARGISEEQARTILTVSFVRSVLDQIVVASDRERLIARLVSRLPLGAELGAELGSELGLGTVTE